MGTDAQIAAEIDELVSTFEAKVNSVLNSYRSPADFTPSSTTHDAYVVTWMKSGTTLCQNLVYQLMAATGRVPTDPDATKFRDISEVVPFIEASPVVNVYQPIHAYSPHVWKSHAPATEFMNMTKFESGRFIYLFREGKTVTRSFLDFIVGWMIDNFESDDLVRKHCMHNRYFLKFFLGLEEQDQEQGDGQENKTVKWVPRKDGGGSGWFKHVKSWIDSDLPNVLFVPYEDLVADLSRWTRVIAAFVGLDCSSVTDDVVQRVVDRCGQNVMALDSRFNDNMISEAFGFGKVGGRRARLPGEKGFAQYKLDEECVKLYDAMFTEQLGFANHVELRDCLRERNERLKKRLDLGCQ